MFLFHGFFYLCNLLVCFEFGAFCLELVDGDVSVESGWSQAFLFIQSLPCSFSWLVLTLYVFACLLFELGNCPMPFVVVAFVVELGMCPNFLYHFGLLFV